MARAVGKIRNVEGKMCKGAAEQWVECAVRKFTVSCAWQGIVYFICRGLCCMD